jgi:hypothetical protein
MIVSMVACDAPTGMFEDMPVPLRVGSSMGFCPSVTGCAGGGTGTGTGLDVLAGGGVTGLEEAVLGLLMVLVELLVPVGLDLSYRQVRAVNSKIQRNVKNVLQGPSISSAGCYMCQWCCHLARICLDDERFA